MGDGYAGGSFVVFAGGAIQWFLGHWMVCQLAAARQEAAVVAVSCLLDAGVVDGDVCLLQAP